MPWRAQDARTPAVVQRVVEALIPHLQFRCLIQWHHDQTSCVTIAVNRFIPRNTAQPGQLSPGRKLKEYLAIEGSHEHLQQQVFGILLLTSSATGRSEWARQNQRRGYFSSCFVRHLR